MVATLVVIICIIIVFGVSSSFNSRIAEHNNEVYRKDSEINELKEEKKSLQSNLSSCQSRYNVLKTEYDALSRKFNSLGQLQEEQEKLKKEREELKKDLDELRGEAIIAAYDFSEYEAITSEECKNKISILKVEEQNLIKNGEAVIVSSEGSSKYVTNNKKQILRCFN